MPVLNSNSFKPTTLFRNGFIGTIYPYYFRKLFSYPYQRQRVETPDNDFFDIDWLTSDKNTKLAILLHGLEGSSRSQYINGLTGVLFDIGYDIAAVNFRSCSGEINLQPEMYHSGYTKDLEYIINQYTDEYTSVVICGFSLGGNVTLKYTGQCGPDLNPKIKAVAAISAPCDLRGVSLKFKKWYNYPYENLFLKTLMQKVEVKHKMFPDIIDISHKSKIKSLWDFDEYYNAAMHQFTGADEYYDLNSSIQFLPNIQIPALILNAKNDSFLSETCYPYHEAEDSAFVHLMTPEYGGHVGFADFRQTKYWSDLTLETFFEKHTN